MSNFLKSLFRKKENRDTQASAEPLTETQILDILSDAIADVGYWNWWTTELPELIQLEFGGTQLYVPRAEPLEPPYPLFAVQFRQPKSISFLTRRKLTDNTGNWFDNLHNDKMEPPNCNHGEFTFTKPGLMTEMIQEAASIHTIHGYSPKDPLFRSEKCKLVFWAGDYGCAVAAEELQLRAGHGEAEVALDKIPSLHAEWWQYWRKYWDLKKTINALPEDYVCEVTIPLKNEV